MQNTIWGHFFPLPGQLPIRTDLGLRVRLIFLRVRTWQKNILNRDFTHHDAAQDYRRLLNQYPEVGTNCSNLKFPGRGQRDTPVVDVRGIVEIVMLLPGRHAARVRRQAAELLCRYLGGDLALVDEVYRNRGFQEQLAVQAPEDPRRLFGEVVEATAGGSQLA